MARKVLNLGLLAALAAAAGCTTMGLGVGSTAAGKDPVKFSWTSSDNVSGAMKATAADGKAYAGQFFQITSDTTVDNLGPLWSEWSGRRLGGLYDWSPGPEFVTHYSGRVVANLSAADGTHMRCRFQLVHPQDGMAAGGHGECQMPGGDRIEAQFPKAGATPTT